MSLNKVMLIGNVGKDPEVRYLEGNSKVASFRIATSERFRDREGRQKEITEWHTVTVWRGLADIVEKYVRKGSLLYVEGRLRNRTWTDRNGAEKTVTEIAGDSIELLGKTPAAQTDAAGKDGGNESSGMKNTWKPMPDIPETDDDLPF